jgi:ribosomal protein S18 acetylase RimI-like enzyme
MTDDRLPLAELLAKAGDGDFLRSVAEAVLQMLMEADVEGLIGAGRHERTGERLNYRNGFRDRTLETRLGALQLRIPKVRQGSYFPPFLEPRKTSEKALVAVIQEAWIGGVSTRRVDELVQAMGLAGISKSTVSKLCKDIDERVSAFLDRPLSGEWPYLWLDATYRRCRVRLGTLRLNDPGAERGAVRAVCLTGNCRAMRGLMEEPLSQPPLPAGIILRHAHGQDDLAACFPVISLLRPRLKSVDEWVERASGMATAGYRVLAAWDGARVSALAGYRVMENLIHDHFLYVDDLVTAQGERGKGLGAALLVELSAIAVDESCGRLVLDTAATNERARRFYKREGLIDAVIGFVKPLGKAA